MGPQSSAAPVQAARPQVTPAPERRDWAAWYDDLTGPERKAVRNRIVLAPFEEVRTDPELRSFFLYHSQDIAEDALPGSSRLQQLQAIVAALMPRADAHGAEQRRKAFAFLFAEYQAYLRDNPWVH